MTKPKAGVLGILIGIPVGAFLSFIFLVINDWPSGDLKTPMIIGTIIVAFVGWAAGQYLGKD